MIHSPQALSLAAPESRYPESSPSRPALPPLLDPVLGITATAYLILAPVPPLSVAPLSPPSLVTQPQSVKLGLTKSALPQSTIVTASHLYVAGTADTTLINVVTMLVEERKDNQARAKARNLSKRKHRTLQLPL